ncbi:MAG: suppressor of fused domain protein [Cyanobacteria bacterium P01_E01_bin.42]
MVDPTRYSECGDPIYEYTQENQQREVFPSNEETKRKLEAHITKYIGTIKEVFHEIISEFVHIDVYIVAPTEERNFYTLVTSGMSNCPMNCPEPLQEFRYAEILICLPPSWPLNLNEEQTPNTYFPIEWLKILARLPHQYESWLSYGHTIPNGDPPEPFADNTQLCCCLLSEPLLFEEEFLKLEINKEKNIYFLSLVPIYQEEMEFKLSHGADALFARLDEFDITELLDIHRLNITM